MQNNENTQDHITVEQVDFNQYLLAESIDICSHHSKVMIGNLLNEIEQVLQASMSGISTDNSLARKQIENAIHAIASKKNEIKQLFINDLCARLNYIAYIDANEKPESRPNRRKNNGAGVTQNIELEISAEKISSDISLHLHKKHHEVNLFYSSIKGLKTANFWSNPYKPELFVFAIINALEAAKINHEAIYTLINSSSTQLNIELEKIYNCLIEFAKDNGVNQISYEELPRDQSFQEDANDLTKKINALMDDEAHLKTKQKHRLNQDELVYFARILLTAIDGKCFESSDLENVLKSSFPGIMSSWINKSWLENIPLEHKENHETKQQKEIIGNIAGMLIDVISDDPRLLDSVRIEIKKLKEYIQAMATSDPSFMTDPSHPMRMVIELICHKSLAFKSEADGGFNNFIEPLKLAVKAYIKKGNKSNDVHIYEWLEKKWCGAISTTEQTKARDESTFEQLKARNAQAYEIRKDIHDRYKHHSKYPGFICNFIDGPWANLIAHLELREKASDELISSAFKTLNNIFWVSDLKAIKGDVTNFCKLTARLQSEIKEGMAILEVTEDDIELSLFLRLFKKHNSNIFTNLNRLSNSTPIIEFDTTHKSPPSDVSTDVWLTPKEKRIIDHIQSEEDIDQKTTNFMSTVIMTEVNGQNVRKLASGADSLVINSWLEIKSSNSWQRMILKNNMNGLLEFLKASGECISMTKEQFNDLNSRLMVTIIIDRSFMSEAFDNLLK